MATGEVKSVEVVVSGLGADEAVQFAGMLQIAEKVDRQGLCFGVLLAPDGTYDVIRHKPDQRGR